MTYSCKYSNSSSFPYSKRRIYQTNNYQKNHNSGCVNEAPNYCKQEEKESKKTKNSFFNSSYIHSLLEPVEKLLGRKLSFDDMLLLVLIYILFTEKESDNDNKTLILCLLFILMG